MHKDAEAVAACKLHVVLWQQIWSTAAGVQDEEMQIPMTDEGLLGTCWYVEVEVAVAHVAIANNSDRQVLHPGSCLLY